MMSVRVCDLASIEWLKRSTSTLLPYARTFPHCVKIPRIFPRVRLGYIRQVPHACQSSPTKPHPFKMYNTAEVRARIPVLLCCCMFIARSSCITFFRTPIICIVLLCFFFISFLSSFLPFFPFLWSGSFVVFSYACVLVPDTLALHWLYLDELRLFGLRVLVYSVSQQSSAVTTEFVSLG